MLNKLAPYATFEPTVRESPAGEGCEKELTWLDGGALFLAEADGVDCLTARACLLVWPGGFCAKFCQIQLPVAGSTGDEV